VAPGEISGTQVGYNQHLHDLFFHFGIGSGGLFHFLHSMDSMKHWSRIVLKGKQWFVLANIFQ
jgi:hypothetical protein